MALRAPLPLLGPSSPPWRFVLAVWAAYGVVYAAVWTAAVTAMGQKASVAYVLPWVLAGAFAVAATWAMLTPVVFALARRVRPGRVGWIVSVLVHGVAAIGCAALVTFVRRLAIATVADFNPEGFLPNFLYWFDVWLFVYLTLVAVGNALGVRRRYVDRSIRAHLLETQLARAQLQYLEIQLQPHFLFNALNSI